MVKNPQQSRIERAFYMKGGLGAMERGDSVEGNAMTPARGANRLAWRVGGNAAEARFWRYRWATLHGYGLGGGVSIGGRASPATARGVSPTLPAPPPSTSYPVAPRQAPLSLLDKRTCRRLARFVPPPLPP